MIVDGDEDRFDGAAIGVAQLFAGLFDDAYALGEGEGVFIGVAVGIVGAEEDHGLKTVCHHVSQYVLVAVMPWLRPGDEARVTLLLREFLIHINNILKILGKPYIRAQHRMMIPFGWLRSGVFGGGGGRCGLHRLGARDVGGELRACGRVSGLLLKFRPDILKDVVGGLVADQRLVVSVIVPTFVRRTYREGGPFAGEVADHCVGLYFPAR